MLMHQTSEGHLNSTEITIALILLFDMTVTDKLKFTDHRQVYLVFEHPQDARRHFGSHPTRNRVNFTLLTLVTICFELFFLLAYA